MSCAKLFHRGTFPVYGSGLATRDYLEILTDIVIAVLFCINDKKLDSSKKISPVVRLIRFWPDHKSAQHNFADVLLYDARVARSQRK